MEGEIGEIPLDVTFLLVFITKHGFVCKWELFEITE